MESRPEVHESPQALRAAIDQIEVEISFYQGCLKAGAPMSRLAIAQVREMIAQRRWLNFQRHLVLHGDSFRA